MNYRENCISTFSSWTENSGDKHCLQYADVLTHHTMIWLPNRKVVQNLDFFFPFISKTTFKPQRTWFPSWRHSCVYLDRMHLLFSIISKFVQIVITQYISPLEYCTWVCWGLFIRSSSVSHIRQSDGLFYLDPVL